MKLHLLAFLAFADRGNAFTIPAANRLSVSRTASVPTRVFNSPPEAQKIADEEIERLKSMAQKLRAEAAALEADRAEELAAAAQHAFERFDINKDGEISFEELKLGLEKALKTELPDERVKKVMEDFDISGDGKLQLDEFVGVDKFSNRLQALAREERQQAIEASKTAQKEAEMAKLLEARLSMLNDGAPTTKDKIISVLPYLFPLMDSLQFGRFLVADNIDNPLVIALGILYGLYRSVPFSGFIAFLTLNVLSGNPGINRLVRFNMQQAIFLDIALFFPGLIGAAVALIGGSSIPPAATAIGSDLIFGGVLLAILYASGSSLLGMEPNKIPFISQAVEDRMPSIDMFDDQGRFMPRNSRDEKKDDKKDD